MPDKFMGAAIAQDEIGWVNIIEGRVMRSWRDIGKQNLAERESCRTALGWYAVVVVGILEMVHSQWKYCCNFLHKQ